MSIDLKFQLVLGLLHLSKFLVSFVIMTGCPQNEYNHICPPLHVCLLVAYCDSFDGNVALRCKIFPLVETNKV